MERKDAGQEFFWLCYCLQFLQRPFKSGQNKHNKLKWRSAFWSPMKFPWDLQGLEGRQWQRLKSPLTDSESLGNSHKRTEDQPRSRSGMVRSIRQTCWESLELGIKVTKATTVAPGMGSWTPANVGWVYIYSLSVDGAFLGRHEPWQVHLTVWHA